MTIDQQIAQAEQDVERASRLLASAQRDVEESERGLRELREKKAKKTPGQEIAEHTFRTAGGWLMMERADQPGTPRNIFVAAYPRVPVVDILTQMRESLAYIVDHVRADAAMNERDAITDKLKEDARVVRHGVKDTWPRDDVADMLVGIIREIRKLPTRE